MWCWLLLSDSHGIRNDPLAIKQCQWRIMQEGSTIYTGQKRWSVSKNNNRNKSSRNNYHYEMQSIDGVIHSWCTLLFCINRLNISSMVFFYTCFNFDANTLRTNSSFQHIFVRKHLVSSWCPSCRFKDRQMCINDWLYFARFVSTVLCYCFDMSTSWSCYMYMFTRKYLYILYPTSLIVSHWHFEIRQTYIKAKWLGSTSVCL